MIEWGFRRRHKRGATGQSLKLRRQTLIGRGVTSICTKDITDPPPGLGTIYYGYETVMRYFNASSVSARIELSSPGTRPVVSNWSSNHTANLAFIRSSRRLSRVIDECKALCTDPRFAVPLGGIVTDTHHTMSEHDPSWHSRDHGDHALPINQDRLLHLEQFYRRYNVSITPGWTLCAVHYTGILGLASEWLSWLIQSRSSDQRSLMFIFFVMHELARASELLFPRGMAQGGCELKEWNTHRNATETLLSMIAVHRGCRQSFEWLVKAHRQIVGDLGRGSYVSPTLSVRLRCY